MARKRNPTIGKGVRTAVGLSKKSVSRLNKFKAILDLAKDVPGEAARMRRVQREQGIDKMSNPFLQLVATQDAYYTDKSGLERLPQTAEEVGGTALVYADAISPEAVALLEGLFDEEDRAGLRKAKAVAPVNKEKLAQTSRQMRQLRLLFGNI